MVVIQIVGLVNGGSTPFDGQYLREYDPSRNGVAPNGRMLSANIVTTPDPGEARQFTDARAAFDCWRQVDKRDPWRADGKPNRPLTAFTIEVKSIEGTKDNG